MSRTPNKIVADIEAKSAERDTSTVIKAINGY